MEFAPLFFGNNQDSGVKSVDLAKDDADAIGCCKFRNIIYKAG